MYRLFHQSVAPVSTDLGVHVNAVGTVEDQAIPVTTLMAPASMDVTTAIEGTSVTCVSIRNTMAAEMLSLKKV